MKTTFDADLPVKQGLASLVGLAMILTAACSATPEREADVVPMDASEPVEPVVKRAPTDEEVMYRVFAGEYLGAEGDLPGAVEEYLVAAMKSDDPEIARRATRIAYAAEAWQQAAMAADRWALLDPENVAAHESAAAAKLSIGDYFGAEYEIIQILDLMGDSTEAWVLVSSLLARSGDPSQADDVLEHILATREQADIGDVYFARSQLAVRSRQFDRGYQLARQAVDSSPEQVEFLTWAGRLALNLKRTGEGLVYVRRAWKLSPDDHDLALAYADLLARNGEEEAARQVMKQMPQTPDVMLSRILFELAAGKQENAEKLFESFAQQDFGDEQEKVFYLAQAAEALGETEQAIEYYGRVETGERALAASIRRAELISLAGDLDSARRELEKIRADGDEIAIEESWLAEARILRESDMREEAFNTLTIAVSQIPSSMVILYTHALFAAELGWVDIAEKGLRKVLSVQPENAAALNALGYTLADQTERYEEAEALIRQAYILQPEEASIIDSMGWISYRLGKLGEAVRYLGKAWSLDKNPEIAAHLGEVLWVMGDRDKARRIWGEGQAIDREDPVLLETIGRLDPQP
jgi:Flp pilus assembly protein TadD